MTPERKTTKARTRTRGICLEAQAVDRALKSRFPETQSRRIQVAETARTGLVSERWLYRCLANEDSPVDLESVRGLAAALRCSVDALIATNDSNYKGTEDSDAASLAPNPYRGMHSHGRGDPLYGRETARATLSRWIGQALDGAGDRTIDLTGPGKTSLLAAGVLKDASEHKQRPAITLLLSPSDFPDNPNDRLCVDVVHAKLTALRQEKPSKSAGSGPSFELGPPPKSMTAFAHELAGIAVRQRPIVIGIDDADTFRGDPEVWAPIDRFVTELLTASPHTCLVTTSRHDAPSKRAPGHSWHNLPSRRYVLEQPTREFLHAVIEEPFENANLRLTATQAGKLIHNTLKLQADATTSEEHDESPLPLLSLTLQLLFEKKRQARYPSGDLRAYYGLSDETASDADSVIRSTDLEVGHTIEARAERAWTRLEKALKNRGKAGRRILSNDDLSGIFCALLYVPAEHVANTPEAYDSTTKAQCLANVVLGTVVRPPFDTFKQFFDDMIADELIRSTEEGMRLAHRSILIHWSRAQKWLAQPLRGAPEGQQPFTGWGLLREISKLRSPNFRRSDLSESVATLVLSTFASWATTSKRHFWLDTPINRAKQRLIRSCDPAAPVPGHSGGSRAIHFLALYGMADVIRSELSELPESSDLDAADLANFARERDGIRPLHMAAFGNDLDTVRALISHGADVTRKDKKGFTALAISATAAPEGEEDTFQLLATCATEGEPNMDDLRLAAYMCVTADSPSRLNTLLDRHPSLWEHIANSGWTLLHQAIRQDSPRIIAELIAKHQEATLEAERSSKLTAIHIAARHGKAKLLEQLLGPEITTPATELIESWLTKKPVRQAPLLTAVENGHADIVALLCNHVSAMERQANGLTALHSAVGAKTPFAKQAAEEDAPKEPESILASETAQRVIKELLRYDDCDWFATDTTKPRRRGTYWGLSPVGQAAKNPARFRDLVDCLTECKDYQFTKSQVEAPCNPEGETFLHLLAAHRHQQWAATKIRTILPEDTSVAVFDANKHSPLAEALRHGHTAAAKGLLGFVDPKLQPKALVEAAKPTDGESGRTPHHLAGLRGDSWSARDLNIMGIGDANYWTQPDHFGMTATSLASGDAREWLIAQGWAEEQRTQDGQRTYFDKAKRGTFSLEPLHDGDDAFWDSTLTWMPLDAPDLDAEVRRAILDGCKDTDLAQHIEVAHLPFYSNDVVITRVTVPSLPPKYPKTNWSLGRKTCRYALCADGKVTPLTGSTQPLHKLASDGKLLLKRKPESDEEWNQARTFLRFFCDFCRGDAGAFLIIEPAAYEATAALGLSHSERQLVKTLAKPVLFHDQPQAETFDCTKTHVSATIWYSNSLFFADFEISPSGLIEMLCDNLLFEGLSAVPDRPLFVDIKEDQGGGLESLAT